MDEGTAYATATADADMAELARLADELVEEIGATRRHYDELRVLIGGDEADQVAGLAAATVEEPAAPERAHEEPANDGRPSAEGARLVALNLALMGIERGDARIKLCDGFDIDPAAVEEILDDAFGAHEPNGNGHSPARRRFRRRRNGNG